MKSAGSVQVREARRGAIVVRFVFRCGKEKTLPGGVRFRGRVVNRDHDRPLFPQPQQFTRPENMVNLTYLCLQLKSWDQLLLDVRRGLGFLHERIILEAINMRCLIV
jgi:hypothetical protein